MGLFSRFRHYDYTDPHEINSDERDQFHTIENYYNSFVDGRLSPDDMVSFTFDLGDRTAQLAFGRGHVGASPAEEGGYPSLLLHQSGDGIRYGDWIGLLETLGNDYGWNSYWEL